MKWEEILKLFFTDLQVELLRIALKKRASVYIYGTGLGKSSLVEALKKAGCEADEPGTRVDAGGPMQVLDKEGLICFCIKKEPRLTIPDFTQALSDCIPEILFWVSQ